MMEETFIDVGMLLGVIGFVFTILFTVIGFMLKGWVNTLQRGIDKMIESLENIKDQINNLQTESQLQRNHMHEMEDRFQNRMNTMDLRMDRKQKTMGMQQGQINSMKEELQEVKVICKLTHK